MNATKALYPLAFLVFVHLIWHGTANYLDRLDEINITLFIVVVRSLVLFVLMMAIFERFLSVGHRKFICFMVILAGFATYQLNGLHTETQLVDLQVERTKLTLDSLFEGFSFEEEKEIDPHQKYLAADYGVFSQYLVATHMMLLKLEELGANFAPHFDVLLDRCFPPPNMLIRSDYRSDCRAAYKNLTAKLGEYPWQLEHTYQQLEGELVAVFYDTGVKQLFQEFFDRRRETGLKQAEAQIQLVEQMCLTGIEIMDLLDAEQDFIWWDDGLFFFNHSKQHLLSDLYHKLESLVLQLHEVSQSDPRVLGDPPEWGLT